MRKAKTYIIIGMTLFVLFCAYWSYGRSLMINTVSSQISDMQSEGYKVVHKGLSIGGFPLKFRGRIAEPNIASPRSTEKPWSIKADDWRMEASTFNPFKWTARHRGEARIDMRGPKGERWLFDARPFNIDAKAKSNLKGDLTSFEMSASKLNMQAVIGTLPPIVAIDKARFKAQAVNADMRFQLNLKNLFLEAETLKSLQTIFGPRIENLEGSALALGLTLIEDDAITAWKKNGQIIGEGWVMSWGGTALQGGFNISTSEAGLSGVVRIEVENINSLISRLKKADILTSRQARNAKLAAILLPVNQNGRKEITITLRDGFLTLFGQKIYEL